ncbi:flagellar hook-length control protein FliK [Bartonella sp. DGB2]|uniref:flagellar hook-length control protein FliK n=1 Tax=Bartonella sp. DGB2 TaxID=3388426 RepID=UPI00398FF0B6
MVDQEGGMFRRGYVPFQDSAGGDPSQPRSFATFMDGQDDKSVSKLPKQPLRPEKNPEKKAMDKENFFPQGEVVVLQVVSQIEKDAHGLRRASGQYEDRAVVLSEQASYATGSLIMPTLSIKREKEHNDDANKVLFMGSRCVENSRGQNSSRVEDILRLMADGKVLGIGRSDTHTARQSSAGTKWKTAAGGFFVGAEMVGAVEPQLIRSDGGGQERLELLLPSFSTIEEVKVLQNKNSTPQMHILRIRLEPAHLGVVEVRLRHTIHGLFMELEATRSETARMLVADQAILGKMLEKAGFGCDHKLIIEVINKDKAIEGYWNSWEGDPASFGQHQSFGQGGRHEKMATKLAFVRETERDEAASEASFYHNPDCLLI